MIRARWVVLLFAASAATLPYEAWAQGVEAVGLAHPRRIRSFIGVFQEGAAPVETQMVKMGLGSALFITSGRTGGGGQYRLELTAGVAAEFDLGRSSFDFMAADFLVGLPLTLRRGPLDGSLRVYHQSSHLGDDMLARDDVVLDSLEAYDFEAVELFVGLQSGRLRPYAGVEYRFRRTPDEQDPSILHLGMDFRGRSRTRLIGGVHGWWADNGGDPVGVKARVGFEVVRSGTDPAERRPVRILLEGTWGHPDAGRFFRSKRETLGLTVEVGR